MFVAENGTKTAVRWAMVPVQGVAPAAGYVEDPNYLFRRLTDDIQSRALRWRLVVTVAGSRDVIDDASQGWAEDDRQIDAGTLTVTTVGSEEGGPCTGITFDPLILPQGIAPSGDPVLSARSAVYMRSFAARSGEKPAAPAVSPISGAASGDAEGKQS
ncbi:catalase family protein [Acetobacter oeni]|uniref:Catalase core domain-containing protein n=1 Tax=Acetobacter oeni TaxID=304077 RepID=A0A511XQA4_9PROT|nr:hypothetical protein [Acetobacter oeni]MBB3884795.1 catalase [Acetobacter oeni]GBR09050.1 catalase [Acetobacter oeni LMG 21952]GEN65150.1 hypothetical protein AOE01nite_33740 [Acetobacter oeni]